MEIFPLVSLYRVLFPLGLSNGTFTGRYMRDPVHAHMSRFSSRITLPKSTRKKGKFPFFKLIGRLFVSILALCHSLGLSTVRLLSPTQISIRRPAMHQSHVVARARAHHRSAFRFFSIGCPRFDTHASRLSVVELRRSWIATSRGQLHAGRLGRKRGGDGRSRAATSEI